MRSRCRYNPCNFSNDCAAVTRHELDCLHRVISETIAEKLARVKRMRKRNAQVFFGEPREQETRSVDELVQQINGPVDPVVEVSHPSTRSFS
ncbi:hypothetical protein Tco_0892871 [Tanacetum coccineum]|uniref:Uncharacterized protein n=1 Tax=Tanacetum coccineum TaxID=301880 RepID=A0ABQ5CCJ1_9ASTR